MTYGRPGAPGFKSMDKAMAQPRGALPKPPVTPLLA